MVSLLYNLSHHMYRGLFCCVGLSIVTSEGLAGLLQCLAISLVIKVHRSGPRVMREIGDLAKASLKVCNSVLRPRDSGGAIPGGGDMFLGRGDIGILHTKKNIILKSDH